MITKAYHISHSKNRESILKNGLIPNEKKEGLIKYAPCIFFSINKKDLGYDYVNYENVDCWEFEVDSKQIKKDKFSGSTNHFYIETPVSSDKLKLIKFI
jgi:hypothetical protein